MPKSGRRGDSVFDCKVVDSIPDDMESTINQYIKNFKVDKDTPYTIKLYGVFLLSWSQYGLWTDRGTCIIYSSGY